MASGSRCQPSTKAMSRARLLVPGPRDCLPRGRTHYWIGELCRSRSNASGTRNLVLARACILVTCHGAADDGSTHSGRSFFLWPVTTSCIRPHALALQLHRSRSIIALTFLYIASLVIFCLCRPHPFLVAPSNGQLQSRSCIEIQ